jgi:hypothetical protein
MTNPIRISPRAVGATIRPGCKDPLLKPVRYAAGKNSKPIVIMAVVPICPMIIASKRTGRSRGDRCRLYQRHQRRSDVGQDRQKRSVGLCTISFSIVLMFLLGIQALNSLHIGDDIEMRSSQDGSSKSSAVLNLKQLHREYRHHQELRKGPQKIGSLPIY